MSYRPKYVHPSRYETAETLQWTLGGELNPISSTPSGGSTLEMMGFSTTIDNFEESVSALGLGTYRSWLLSDSAYRAQFREQLRLALMMDKAIAAKALPPLGAEMMELEGNFEFLRRVSTIKQDIPPTGMKNNRYQPPYQFTLDNTLDNYHLRLELLHNKDFRQAFIRRCYQALSPAAQKTRRVLAELRVTLHELLQRPHTMRTQMLEHDPELLEGAFELLGSRPCQRESDYYGQPAREADLYNLASLVEHYCAIFGHTPQQEEYLQQQGKRVYLDQFHKEVDPYLKGRKIYYPVRFDMTAVRRQIQEWYRIRDEYPGAKVDNCVAVHYIQQAILAGSAASLEQARQLMEEFIFESTAPYPNYRGQEICNKVMQGLAYSDKVLMWFEETFSHQLRFIEIAAGIRPLAADIIIPNRLKSLNMLLQWSLPSNGTYPDGLMLEFLFEAAEHNNYDIFMFLLKMASPKVLADLTRLQQPDMTWDRRRMNTVHYGDYVAAEVASRI